MALAGGRPPQQPAADELGDLAWLGSLVSPGGTSAEPAAATAGRRASPNLPSSLVPNRPPSLKTMASAPLLVASAQSSSSSPVASTSTSGHSHPVALARADSRRRTSSGPPAPPFGLGLPESGRPMPRGPNTSQQQQQQQPRSPVRHSPSASHGSFFSAFRRSSNSHQSSLAPTPSAASNGGRAPLSPTSTTAAGGSPLGSTSSSSSYVVPVIKDEHALHRSRTLAKQLLGPSLSAGRHRSPEGLGVTREDDDDGAAVRGLQRDETHHGGRHVTADGVSRNSGGPGDRGVSVGSHGTGSTGGFGGQARSPPHTHGHGAARQHPHHDPSRAELPQASSSLGRSVPGYISEPATEASVAGAGGRVVRIDGRLFRFDASGDRLDLVPPREATTDPHPSASSSPMTAARPSRAGPLTALDTSAAPSHFLPDLTSPASPSPIAGTPVSAALSSSPASSARPLSDAPGPPSSVQPSSAGSSDFYGDVLGYRFSTMAVDSPFRQSFPSPTNGSPAPPLPPASVGASNARVDNSRETLLSPSSAGDSHASPLSTTRSSAGRTTHHSSEGSGATASDSLSTAEVELVQSAVHAHSGEQGHVVEFKPLPAPAESLLLATTAASATATAAAAAAALGSRPPPAQVAQPQRPSLHSRASAQSSDETIAAASFPPALHAPPGSQGPARATGGLPFGGRATGRGQEVSEAATFHSARSSVSSSQRPTPAPLIIPHSTSDPRLGKNNPFAGADAGAGSRAEADGDDDDRPLALRLQKLQNRDSSPAVLVSPVATQPLASPSAADRPPPLPAKSQSFSFPAQASQQQQAPTPTAPSEGWVPVSQQQQQPRAPGQGVPRDPYEVLSRPMPKELDTSAQMREKLMRSMTGFGKVAKKSARTRMEQVVDAARHQLAANPALTAPHLGVPRSTSTPASHPSSSHAHAHLVPMRPAPVADPSHVSATTAAGLHGHGYPSPGSGLPALPPRPPSPMREALSLQVHTSDSLARRMAEVEDEDERRLAENMFM